MNILVGTNRISLDKTQAIGSGGEGTVFRVQISGIESAVKIYEQEDLTRIQKLKAFLKKNFNLPGSVLKPKELVFNSQGNIVGFTMPLLPSGSDEFARLSNRKFRTSYGVNNRDVTTVFLDAAKILSLVHKQGLVVGDLNSLNTFFIKDKTYWIDVDSWQFANFSCPVATEEFLDPTLYGKDLSQGVFFRSDNDWYSYAVLLFKSLLLVHPYGGTHKYFKLLTERAKRRITAFDSDVVYPKIALPKDVVDDSLLQVFHEYFKMGTRNEFPITLLEHYRENLIECPSCKTWYSGTRKLCPFCSIKTIIIVKEPKDSVSRRGLTVEEIFHTDGQLIMTKVDNDRITALTRENGKIFLIKLGGINQKSEMFGDLPGARYEIFDDTLVVNPAHTLDLYMIDVSGINPKPHEKTNTGIFTQNRRAVFKATKKGLLRLASSTLVSGQKLGSTLIERQLANIVESQTWFWSDSDSESPHILGLFQIMRQQVYWVYSEKGFFELPLSPLELGEVLIDVSVKFSGQEILLLRKSQIKGVDYFRREILNFGGEVVYSQFTKLEDYQFSDLHSLIFENGIALHATDDGIVQEKIEVNFLKTFSNTKPYVSGGDRLIKYNQGILVVKEDRILHLKLS